MPVRIGLIGSGFVSNFYMLGLKDLSGWEVPVVASPTADHSRRFAEKWEIAESTTDVLGVIRRDDIDLVVLGAPNFVHKELALACAAAGKHGLHQATGQESPRSGGDAGRCGSCGRDPRLRRD